MHAYISFQIESSSPALPIQYTHFIQSYIYAALSQNISSRIHDEGYSVGNRNFKMFSFITILRSTSYFVPRCLDFFRMLMTQVSVKCANISIYIF